MIQLQRNHWNIQLNVVEGMAHGLRKVIMHPRMPLLLQSHKSVNIYIVHPQQVRVHGVFLSYVMLCYVMST